LLKATSKESRAKVTPPRSVQNKKKRNPTNDQRFFTSEKSPKSQIFRGEKFCWNAKIVSPATKMLSEEIIFELRLRGHSLFLGPNKSSITDMLLFWGGTVDGRNPANRMLSIKTL